MDSTVYKDVYWIRLEDINDRIFEDSSPVEMYIAKNYGLLAFRQKNGILWKRI